MESGRPERHHLVLVHGLCHGAWCWYKVATALESAGHRVTAPDLAASGAHPARLHEVRSFEDYSRPLLDAVAAAPDGDRLVLVGHSFGGHNLALAMERFPRKHRKAGSTPDSFLDSTSGVVETGSENPAETFLLGPEWMSQRMYQLSPAEDLTLAKTLVRPAQMFLGDDAMAGENVLTEDRYGAVSRVFVITEEDRTWPAEEQREAAASGGPSVETQLVIWIQVFASVTALDMAACGASPGRAEEVPSFEEYIRPLLTAVAGLPPDEKAVLVGHSFGGMGLALAMERYPDRVAVAVFVAAGMPAAGKPMAAVFEQRSQEEQPADRYMDCEFVTSGDPQHPVETFRFGPRYLKQRLYQLSPPEDLTLAMATVRPQRLFRDDATMNGDVLTAEGYCAVRRVCVVAEEDGSLPAGFQRKMASLNS